MAVRSGKNKVCPDLEGGSEVTLKWGLCTLCPKKIITTIVLARQFIEQDVKFVMGTDIAK